MSKKQNHLEKIETLKSEIENHPTIDEMKKSLILERIEEWKHDEDAMSLIPNKLLALYEDDLRPLLAEIGLI